MNTELQVHEKDTGTSKEMCVQYSYKKAFQIKGTYLFTWCMYAAKHWTIKWRPNYKNSHSPFPLFPKVFS